MKPTLYKLISGEELVAENVTSGETDVVIKNAVALVYHQVDDGRMSVGFAPFMPYATGNITLFKSSIASSAEPKDEISQEYTRIFSGIVIAPASTKVK